MFTEKLREVKKIPCNNIHSLQDIIQDIKKNNSDISMLSSYSVDDTPSSIISSEFNTPNRFYWFIFIILIENRYLFYKYHNKLKFIIGIVETIFIILIENSILSDLPICLENELSFSPGQLAEDINELSIGNECNTPNSTISMDSTTENSSGLRITPIVVQKKKRGRKSKLELLNISNSKKSLLNDSDKKILF